MSYKITIFVVQCGTNMKKYNYRLPDEIADELIKEAKEKGLTPSSMLRMILSQRYGQTTNEREQTPPKQQKPVKQAANSSKDWSSIVQSYWKEKKKGK